MLGKTGLAGIMRASVRPTVTQRVNQLYRMIETKELSHKTAANYPLSHNNVAVLNRSDGAVLNFFYCSQGAADDMAQNTGNRIGDELNVRGVMIKGIFENALNRSRVYFRVMVLKGAKGEPFSRATIFKNDSDNKMLDQINTDRYSIVAQKVFTVQTANQAPITVDAAGQIATGGPAGIGSKLFKLWIPGYKFGRNGHLQYENGSQSQVKFYDYRVCVVAYDWYGTPQDVNVVGRINELYTKVYFKDA